jgi:hypothetical protein
MRASVTPCEGGAADQSCFTGCQFGGNVRSNHCTHGSHHSHRRTPALRREESIVSS